MKDGRRSRASERCGCEDYDDSMNWSRESSIQGRMRFAGWDPPEDLDIPKCFASSDSESGSYNEQKYEEQIEDSMARLHKSSRRAKMNQAKWNESIREPAPHFFVRGPVPLDTDRDLCYDCRSIDFRAVSNISGKDLGEDGIPIYSFRLQKQLSPQEPVPEDVSTPYDPLIISAAEILWHIASLAGNSSPTARQLSSNEAGPDSCSMVDHTVIAQSTCSMCRLISGVIIGSKNAPGESSDSYYQNPVRFREWWEKREFHLRAINIDTFFWHADNIPLQEKRVLTTVLIVCDGKAMDADLSGQTRQFQFQRGYLRISTLQESNLDRESPLSETRINDSSIDFVSKILQTCQAQHECGPESTLKYPWSARVIDCDTNEIVTLTQSMKYIALSYVWGRTGNEHQPQSIPPDNELRLPKVLPRTLQDAMLCCQTLGYRYLWIDRYCIRQYHSADKTEQIKQMANIYAWATATICALEEDDNSGLPGFSRPLELISSHSQGLKVEWIQRHLKYYVRESVWATRGWTLQELVLSPRALFLTREGPIVACHGGIFSEERLNHTPWDWTGDSFRREDLLFYDPEILDPNNLHTILFSSAHRYPPSSSYHPPSLYVSLREQYLSRSIGYEEDALNAFQSILFIVGVPSLWGIAIPSRKHDLQWHMWDLSYEQMFNIRLQWHVAHYGINSPRCKDILPSWSWATQTKGVVENEFMGQHGIKPQPVDFWPHLWVRGHDSKWLRLQTVLNTSSTVLDPNTTELKLKTVIARWKRAPIKNGPFKRRRGRYVVDGDLEDSDPDQHDIDDSKVKFTWVSEQAWTGLLGRECGRAYLDNLPEGTPISYPPKPFRPGENGLAVLLHMQTCLKHNPICHCQGDTWLIRMIWLMVENVNGVYKRKGLLKWNYWWWTNLDGDISFFKHPKSGLRKIIIT